MWPWKPLADRPADTYRFFLQNCQCKLIFLALCHDNGYISELDKYRNDPIAKQKTWLVDHYAKGRAFIDPPFPMAKFEAVFSTRPLPSKRVNTSAPLASKSSYSSALTSTSPADQAPNPEQTPFSMYPNKSRANTGLQSPTTTTFEPQRDSVKESPARNLAPGVGAPNPVDQIPVVCPPFSDDVSKHVILSH